MKKTKFISCLLSAVLILSAITVPVAAADVNQNSSGGKATVSYTNDSVWTATIPAYVAPVEAGQQDVSAYEVAVKDVVIGDNQQLSATIEYSGYVTEENGVQIPYQLYDSTGKEIQSGDTVLSKGAGEPTTETAVTFGAALTDTPKYAGVYTDTATFSFAENEKVYTLDEINADEHMFAIGNTKPEYVVAKFNDDFSAVTVFANGENSDGKMQPFRWQGQLPANDPVSPMAEHAETLMNAVIEEGVVNISKWAFWDCVSLESITFNHSSTLTSIDDNAFDGCVSISAVNLNDLSALRSIGFGAFNDCSSLTFVDMSGSNNLMSIGEFAFTGCGALTAVDVTGTSKYLSINAGAFDRTRPLTIYGSVGSPAERFAASYGFTFIAQ